jgi:hypothetical protein
LTVLRGLASQLQNQLAAGVDEVLNAVMDAMNDLQQQQQPQQQQAPTAAGRGNAPTAVGAAVAAEPTAAADAVACPLNMNRVNWLRGLPVPTAAGTVAVLGFATLFVSPDSCQPQPTTLLPSHLLCQFVLPECVAALSWALKYPEVREELGLAFYGLQHLAAHLKDALGPIWEFVAPTHLQPPAMPAASLYAASSSSGHGRGGVETSAAAAAGLSSSAAAAAVPWKDGACGGPYLDWLLRLWSVILHTIAAVPIWQEDLTWGAAAAADAAASSSRGSTGSRVAGSIGNAAERARGLGGLLADVLAGGDAAAAMLAQAEYANEQAGAGMFGSAAPNSALVAAASAAGAAELIWRPLAEWPLLPLADGRLLKLKHRELVMAVLPEYADEPAAAAAAAAGFGDNMTDVVQPHDAGSWVSQ